VATVCTLTMTGSLRLAPVLLAGLAVFDTGLFSAQVANQSAVLGIDPARPATVTHCGLTSGNANHPARQP
jgi:hypothetical protein